jgi:opacity protein-like surface antigen
MLKIMKHYYCKAKLNILKILKIKTFVVFFMLFYPAILNARTVGNYIGIDLIKTNLSFSTEETRYNMNTNNNEYKKSIQTDPSPRYSFGLKYNYALNYRGFFIAPGLIYEDNKVKNYFNRSSDNRYSTIEYFGKSYSKINKRYGIKIDIGADINEDFSIYGTIGSAINHYENYGGLYRYYYTVPDITINGINNFSPPLENSWKGNKGKKTAPFFGGGFRIKLYKNWLLNGEYNYTRFTVDLKAENLLINYPAQSRNTEAINKYYNNNISIFKLGINYNF